MITRRGRRPILFGLLVLIILSCVTACTPTDAQLLQSFVEDWAKEKSGLNKGFSGDIAGAIGDAMNSATDPTVQAALEAKNVMDNIAAADKLANQGVANGDVTKV